MDAGGWASIDEAAREMGCKRFKSSSLTEFERAVADAAIGACRAGFNFRECFYNAKRVVRADKSGRLDYCEGAAFHGAFWFPHAWATINGKVVDPTGPLGFGEPEPAEVSARKRKRLRHLLGATSAVLPVAEPTRIFGTLSSDAGELVYVGWRLRRASAYSRRDSACLHPLCMRLALELSGRQAPASFAVSRRGRP